MSKGAVAKRYQPYRKLAEEQAIRLDKLERALRARGIDPDVLVLSMSNGQAHGSEAEERFESAVREHGA